jgi:hypothetical protein
MFYCKLGVVLLQARGCSSAGYGMFFYRLGVVLLQARGCSSAG